MDAVTSIPTNSTREVPTGPTVSEMMEEFYRVSGIVPPTAREVTNLPPWTDEEAVAFERTINELFEQIEASPDHP